MIDLIVLVEGKTEMDFVDEILVAHLRNVGYSSVSARLIAPGGAGICGWERAKTNIRRHLRKNAYVTTMVDYYELPQDWPGRDKSRAKMTSSERAKSVERAIRKDMRGEDAAENLIPYVMLHEFEAMLFSDCQKFAYAIGYPQLKCAFQEIRDEFSTPEDIDNCPEGAPSKRIEALLAPIDVYRKPLVGLRGAIEIGLDAIRAECPHFAKWMDKLEEIPHINPP